MIADLILGYALYAPATLVVKGLEGAIVGFLGSAEPDVRWSLKYRRLLAIAAAGALALAIFILGSNYYTGLLEFNVGSPLISVGFSLDLPVTFWIALSLITLIAIPYFSLRYDVRLSWQTVTVLIGGAEMVVGYYLYEQLILGAAAIAEVPINFGQMMIGAVVAIPLVRAIRSRVPRIVG